MKNFILEHNIAINIAILFLTFQDSGKISNDFKHGNMKVLDINKSNEFINYWKQLQCFNKTIGIKFARIIIQLYERQLFDINTFINKIKLQPYRFVNCANTHQYKSMIEDIYNYKNRNKISLRY